MDSIFHYRVAVAIVIVLAIIIVIVLAIIVVYVNPAPKNSYTQALPPIGRHIEIISSGNPIIYGQIVPSEVVSFGNATILGQPSGEATINCSSEEECNRLYNELTIMGFIDVTENK